jgi:hypothetical protein
MRIRAIHQILPFIAVMALTASAGAQPANDRNNEHQHAAPPGGGHPAPHADAPAVHAPAPQPHFAGPPAHQGGPDRHFDERRVEERHFEERRFEQPHFEPRHFEERRFDGHPHWGGYERRFPDREAWHRGEWRHEWHDGRYGWWWSVGPEWYLFPAPVYPYPEYAVVAPPPVVVQPAPPVSGAPPSQFWYYCNSPQGYYPQVPNCNGPWQEVPATAQQ